MEDDNVNAADSVTHPIVAVIPVILPPPKEFQPCTEPTTLASRWKKWKSSFTYFINATGMLSDAQKRSTLLHLLGEETQEIFETFEDTGTSLTDALAKLDEHFIPRRNVTYERSIFRKSTQTADETADQFCTRLRKLALHCEYTDVNTELRDHFVSTCKSSKLRKRLLTEVNLTLDKTLTIARAMEQSYSQNKAIEGHGATGGEEVNRMNQRGTQNQKSSFNRRNYNNNSKGKNYQRKPNSEGSDKGSPAEKKFECGKCGMTNHTSRFCKVAADKTCSKCGYKGHLAKKCRTKNFKKSPHRAHMATLLEGTKQYQFETGESESSEDDVYVFRANHRISLKQPKFTVGIGDQPVDMIIDSGATLNLLDESSFQKLKDKVKLQPSNLKIYPILIVQQILWILLALFKVTLLLVRRKLSLNLQ